MTAAAEDQRESFGTLLHSKFDTRCIGLIGAAQHLDKEMEVLHRTVRVINVELMEIEADQKHVPVLLKHLGLTQSNIVKTPRVKLSASEAETIENSPIFDGKQTKTSRSGTMRCAYTLFLKRHSLFFRQTLGLLISACLSGKSRPWHVLILD